MAVAFRALLLTSVICLTVTHAASAEVLGDTDPILLKPPAGKTGTPKVFIMINGAEVANTHYVEVCQAVQAASEFNLWVAIPSFLINTPNPGQINSKIKSAISAIADAGFPGGIVDPAKDVVVAGHSLGGIFSQKTVVQDGYAAVVMFGSYISSTNGYHIYDYPKPVLTLGGEMDGLTRVTRIAKSWTELQTRIGTDGEDAKFEYPVVVLPGVSHSQFCSGVNVTAFGLFKDKCPEATWPAAHKAIGANVAAFLTILHDEGDKDAAKELLTSGMKYTSELVAGYLAAEAMDVGDWCADAQQQEAATIGATISVNVTQCSSFASFDLYNPSIQNKQATVVQELQYTPNPTDLSTVYLCAKELDCKINTAASLAKALGKAAPSVPSKTCQSHNDAVIKTALSMVTAATKTRYTNIEKQLTTAEDVVYSTGVTWQGASFGFDTSGDTVKVTSPRLTIATDASLWPGSQLCKYLTPSRVIEYAMVDGLPAFDACPAQRQAARDIVVV